MSRRSGLPPDLAAAVCRAVLQTVVERMTDPSTDPTGPSTDPTGYLPAEFDTGAPHGPEEFLRRVGERAGVDERTAGIGAAAVFGTLREAVTVDEFQEMVARLPTTPDGSTDPLAGPGGR